jgi:LAO/AO transport system kinase
MISDDPQYYINGVRQFDRRILAKAITMIESAHPAHRDMARIIIDQLLPHTGRAVRLGITGVPGVGKSTFVENFGMMLVGKGHKVAVLAVDPSSTRSGGSIMADKTRMERLAVEKDAFIRPSPAGTTLGGVAGKTRETLLICEAAGFDVIIVETVGVGQSETTVASMVDFFLVLMLAGAGDELQGIKKGILELADAVAVNKADGDNIEKARKARRLYENALHLLNPTSPRWRPPVLTCSALATEGLREIWQKILSHRDLLEKSGELQQKRRGQALDWMWSMVEEELKYRFHSAPGVKEILPGIIRSVEKGALSPTIAAGKLLFSLDNKGKRDCNC